MNSTTILDLLPAIGVPPTIVSIGVEADHRWCLVPTAGEGTSGWEVFWREQGNRYDWARFSSEQVACHYLFGRLTWSQVLRGVVGVLPAAEPSTEAGPPAQSGPSEPSAEAVAAVAAVEDEVASAPTAAVPVQGAP